MAQAFPSYTPNPPVPAAEGAVAVGLSAVSRAGVIAALRRGLPVEADLLSIPRRTLTRRRRDGRLHPLEGERLYRFAQLLERAEQLTGGRGAARRWLRSPKLALSGRTPPEYAGAKLGAEEVLDLITRTEHGVFS